MRFGRMALAGAMAVTAVWTAMGATAAGAVSGGIAGRVTGPGGAAAAGVKVYVEMVPYTQAEGHQGETVTGVDGSYTVAGLAPGNFTVTFEPPVGSPLVPERYDDESDFTGSGTPNLVTVIDAVTTSAIDAQLALGYSISGRVTGPGAVPLAGVTVGAYEQSLTLVGNGHQAEAVTAADGTYRLDRLLPGSYRVGFSKSGWRAELYDNSITNAGLTPVVITAADRVGIDAELERGAETPFESLSPSRLLDTRSGLGAVSAGRVAGGSVVQLSVGGRGGVPVDAVAAVLNVTVTEPSGSGFVTVFPCGEAMPTASSVNFVAGQTVANAVVAKLGASGSVCLFSNVSSHLVVDVNGAFAA